MKPFYSLLALLATMLLLSAMLPVQSQTPDDVVKLNMVATPGPIALSGVNATVFKAQAFSNPFDHSGHYNSSLIREWSLLDSNGLPLSLEKWYGATPAIPESVFNVTPTSRGPA
jgi:hypothetical protein